MILGFVDLVRLILGTIESWKVSSMEPFTFASSDSLDIPVNVRMFVFLLALEMLFQLLMLLVRLEDDWRACRTPSYTRRC